MDDLTTLEAQRQKQLEAEREKLTQEQRKHLDQVCAILKANEVYNTEIALKAAQIIRYESGIRLATEIKYLIQDASQPSRPASQQVTPAAQARKPTEDEKAPLQRQEATEAVILPKQPISGAWSTSWTLESNAVQMGSHPLTVQVGQPEWFPTQPSPQREFLDNAFYAAGQEVGGPTIINPPFRGSPQPDAKGPKPSGGTPTPSSAAPAAPPAPHSQSPLNPKPAPKDGPLTADEIMARLSDPSLQARYQKSEQTREHQKDSASSIPATPQSVAARNNSPAETQLGGRQPGSSSLKSGMPLTATEIMARVSPEERERQAQENQLRPGPRLSR